MVLCVVATYLVGCSTPMDIEAKVYACRVKDWFIVDKYNGKDTFMLLERMDNRMEFYIVKTEDNMLYPVNSIVPLAILNNFRKSFR